MDAGPVALFTRRLRMREFAAIDRDDIARELANPIHRRFVLPLQHGDAYVDSIVAEALAAAREEPRRIYRLVIACVESARYLGYCTLHVSHGAGATAHLGFEIAESASGRGVASEAGRALVDFAFDRIKVDRVFADTDERNMASRRTLARIGFTAVRLWPWHRLAMWRRYRSRQPYVRMGLSRAQWRVLPELAAASERTPAKATSG